MRKGRGGLCVAVAVAAWAAPARANQVFASDCAFGFADFYGVDEMVCVTGDVDTVPPGEILAAGDVYVVPHGGAPLDDVTAGGANHVVGTGLGGAFYDETVWLPPLVPGEYDLVLDEHPLGTYGAEDYRSPGVAFTVRDVVTGADIDVAGIKGAAREQADRYQGLARRAAWLPWIANAIDIAGAFVVGPFEGWITLGANVIGWITGLPTSYNDAVIQIGARILGGLARGQHLRYRDLADDPPDSAFAEFVGLDLADVDAGYPFRPASAHPVAGAQQRLENLLAEQAALVVALRRSIEKFQGARAARDNGWQYLQAQKVSAYGTQLVDVLSGTEPAVDALAAAVAASGGGGRVVPVADVARFRAEVAASGFAAGDRATLASFGLTGTGIDALAAEVAAREVPDADFTIDGFLAEVRALAGAVRPAVAAVVADAGEVMAANAPYFRRDIPAADAGGPYAGTVGVAATLDATRSAHRAYPAGSLAFAWDLDGDGEFDDVTGSRPSFTPAAPGRLVVGVRVSDPAGGVDLDYASVDAAAGNRAPAIDSFTPADLDIVVAVGERVDFGAAASDPDGDPVSFAWTVNGAPAGTGAAIAVDAAAVGVLFVELTVADDDAFSPDAREHRLVRVASAGGEDGGDADAEAGADSDGEAGGEAGGDADGGDVAPEGGADADGTAADADAAPDAGAPEADGGAEGTDVAGDGAAPDRGGNGCGCRAAGVPRVSSACAFACWLAGLLCRAHRRRQR